MATKTYTFVGPKLPEDWSVMSILVDDAVAGRKAVLRGQTFQMEEKLMQRYLADRYKIVEGPAAGDPMVSPAALDIELDHAQIVMDFAPGTAAPTDVPGLAITVDETKTNDRPYMVEAFVYGLTGSALKAHSYIQIVDVATNTVVASAKCYVVDTNMGDSKTATCRIPPAANLNSARQFKMQTVGEGVNQPIIQAIATSPAFLRAYVV